MYKAKLKNERLGQVNTNRFGTEMKIIDYKNVRDVTVEFLDDHHYITHTHYTSFRNGQVSNPYDKTVCGVGFLGEGVYGAGKANRRAYITWMDILRRCYHINSHQQCYDACEVCDEWHNFQNFAQWYYKNVYDANGEVLHIDKDLLCFNNKTYGPDTCLLVPERINYLIIRHAPQRGKYPIGVRKIEMVLHLRRDAEHIMEKNQ